MKARFAGWWEQYGPWPYVGLALLVVAYMWGQSRPTDPFDAWAAEQCWAPYTYDGRNYDGVQDCKARLAEEATASADASLRE